MSSKQRGSERESESELKSQFRAIDGHLVRFEKTFEDQRNIFLVYEKSHGGEFFQTVVIEGQLTERLASSWLFSRPRRGS